MAAERKTKHQQGEKRATEEKPEKQELEKPRKKQHTWQLSLNVDMLSLLTYAHKNLGNSYTLLTNSGTPPSFYPSLPPTTLTSHAHCLPPRFPGQWKRCWYSGITDALRSADVVGDFHVFFTQKHILFPYQWLPNWWPWIDCWHTQLWHQASSHTSFSSANRSSPKRIHRQVGLAQSKWTQRRGFGYCHVQELLSSPPCRELWPVQSPSQQAPGLL